jgi:hypothetical protein
MTTKIKEKFLAKVLYTSKGKLFCHKILRRNFFPKHDNVSLIAFRGTVSWSVFLRQITHLMLQISRNKQVL